MVLTSVSTAFAVEGSTSFPAQTDGTADVGSEQSVKISQSASWDEEGEPGDATLTLTYTGAEAQVPGVQQHDYAILIDCSQSPDPIALWKACVSFVTQINEKDKGASFYVLSENGKENGVNQLYAPNTGYSKSVADTLAGVSKVIRGIYNTTEEQLPVAEEPTDDYWNPWGGPSAGSLVSQDYVLPASMQAQDVHRASGSSRPLMIVTITDGDQVYAPQDWMTDTPEKTEVEWRGDTYTVEFKSPISATNVEGHGNVTYGGTTFAPSYAGYIYGKGNQDYGFGSVNQLEVEVTKNNEPYTDEQLRADFGLPEHRVLTEDEIRRLPPVYQMLLESYQLENSYLPRFAMNLLLYKEFSGEFDVDTEIVSLTVNKADVQSVSSSVEDMYSIVPANAMAKYFCTDEDHYFEATNNNDYSSLIEGLITSLTKSDSMSVVIDSANFSVDEEALEQVIAKKGEGWSYQINSASSTVTITFPPTEGAESVSVDIPLIAKKPLGTTQSEGDQDYARVTVESGGVGSAWANVTDLNGDPLTVSCGSTWLTAYDLTYHDNAQQSGAVSDMPEPKTLYYAPRTEVGLEGAPTHSDVNGTSVVFLGWTEEQTTKIYDQNDELPTLVTTQTMTEDRDVYAAWAYDRNGDTIPDARQITVTPADIIIYMGGDEGNEGVVNDSGTIVSETPTLPEFGFTFELPASLEQALDADGKDITDVTFSGAEGRTWTVAAYPGSEGAKNKVYSIVPPKGQQAVRVQFTTSDGNKVTSDDFEVGREVNTTFAMSLYTGAAGQVTANYDGQSYRIIIAEGTLSVRGTTSGVQYGGAPSAGKPGMSVAEDTVFRINDSDVLVDESGVYLLFDKIIDTNSENRTSALIQRAERAEREESLDLPGEAGTRSYELRYLDLVDTHNGNTWVTATDSHGNGRDVTVSWPLPKGTNKNTEFSLVHFKDLDRDMAADGVADKIKNCEVERLDVTVTDTHVTFTVESGNFSPFALVWSNEPSSISITKNVTADDGLTAPDSDFTFNVTLKDAAGNPVTSGITYVVYEGDAPTDGEQSQALTLDASGMGTITLESGQTALLSGVPAWGSYTVQEVKLPAGFAVANGSEATHTGTLVAGETAEIAVTNNYSVTGTATATPAATKTLNGTAPATDQFSFALSTDAEGNNVVEAKTNDAQGRVTFSTLSFSPANLGDNTYYIREVAGNALGYDYDDAVYKLVYTVSDDGEGGIEVSKTTITKIAADGTESSAQDVAFANTYHPVPSEPTAELSGTKTIGGQDTGEYTLEAGDFTFKVTGAVANAPTGTTAPAPSKVSADGTTTNDASGAITFGTLIFVEPGTYTYTVSELQPTMPGEAIPGISYDGAGTTYTLTFEVEDVDGKLMVTDSSVTRQQGGTTTDAALDELDFENSYNPAEKSVTLGGVKQLEGRAWETADRFTFELLDENGKVIDTAEATAASPSFSFDPITYTTEGTHTYTIREVTTGLDATLTPETEPYQVTVTVDDVDAKLVATQSIANADVVFVNSYTPTPVSLRTTISGVKTLTGRDEVKPLQEDEFTFQLLSADGNLIEEATNAADGSFSFAFAPTYDAEGTYTYLVREKVGSVPGVTYDGSTYVVTVKVAENRAAHALEVTDVTYALAQSGAAATEVGAIEFTNVYEAAPVSVALAANKQLTGRDLAADEFDFTLSDAEGAVVSQASNSAKGGVAFDPISFDEPGVYEFTISELAGSAEGVTYDDATYAVTVTVTDDGAGTLHAEVAYGTDDGTVPTFANTYTPPTPATEGTEQIPGTGDPGSVAVLAAAVTGTALLFASRRR